MNAVCDLENTIITGNCLDVLRGLPDGFVNCCVTSPPYWGLRDYGVSGQIGLEETPDAFVSKMVVIFREARRVLRDDGTLWLNLGDTYAASRSYQVTDNKHPGMSIHHKAAHKVPPGFKPKDLIGIPWMVAFALRNDGWYLRSDIVWHKPSAMPESVTDRPTRAHEFVFLMSKSQKYYYDADAIREPYQRIEGATPTTGFSITPPGHNPHTGHGKPRSSFYENGGRNKRDVWSVNTKPFPEAHFATFPPALVEPCIKAGAPADGIVLDPFMGAGTVALVSKLLGRKFIGIELNPDYVAIAEKRIAGVGCQLEVF